MFGQHSSPLPWHEHARPHLQTHPREVDPADDLFERFTRDPASHQFIESLLRTADRRRGAGDVMLGRRLKENHRFVFSEDTAGSAQCCHRLWETRISLNPRVNVVSRVEAPGMPGLRRQREPRYDTSRDSIPQ